jgi:hypothetical protein
VLKHWLIDLVGHVSGLSEAQLGQIEKALPRTKALIDLLNKAQPIIEQAHSLYIEAEPLIDQAMKEWQTVGPAAQILIDVISHHVGKGSSPAGAAEAMRAALGGSIRSVAADHWVDRAMSCVTVFGGTGFLGRRIVYQLGEPRITVRVGSRHPGQTDGDDVKQIAANAHDERFVEAAIAGADGVVNAISLYVEHGRETFHSVHVEAATRIASVARRVGVKRLGAVIARLAKARGLKTEVVEWGFPRNASVGRGYNVKDAARKLTAAPLIVSADCVLFVDDALTGSRFIDIAEALRHSVGKDRIAVIAMQFEFPKRE